MTRTLFLEIPGDVLESVKLPPDEIEKEFRQELALALYRRGILPSGKACVLARMTRWQFETLLGQRQIPRHYTAEDLEDDFRYAQSHQ